MAREYLISVLERQEVIAKVSTDKNDVCICYYPLSGKGLGLSQEHEPQPRRAAESPDDSNDRSPSCDHL